MAPSSLPLGLLTVILTACAATSQNPADSAQNGGCPAPGVLSSGPAARDAAMLTEKDTAESRTVSGGVAALAVRLDGDGGVTVDGATTSDFDAARARATQAVAGGGGDLRVVLYVDEGVSEQRILEAVREMRQAGVFKIGIMLTPPAPPAAAPAPAPPTGGTPPGESLPEVAVKNVGLHIGGGPNDDATKEPFRKAIAARFDDFRRCYPKVAKPGQGGTFGVDLKIGARGGKPEVRQPRTGMGGQAFRDCVLGVFSEVEFQRPPHGATVISYSIRFTVGGE
jgi:biopolymer transport protein ExbD